MRPATTVATTVWAIRSGVRVAGSTSLISKTAAPRIAGMAMSRLNPTAQALDSPRPSAAAMVRPLRLTPGKGAIIWARPISRASAHDVCSGPLSPRAAGS